MYVQCTSLMSFPYVLCIYKMSINLEKDQTSYEYNSISKLLGIIGKQEKQKGQNALKVLKSVPKKIRHKYNRLRQTV